MVPKCIEERDVQALRSIVLAYQVRAALRDVQAIMYYDEQLTPLMNDLLAVLPDDVESSHKAIVASLPHLSDEQVLWLMDNIQASYLRFRVAEELIEHRPHLK